MAPRKSAGVVGPLMPLFFQPPIRVCGSQRPWSRQRNRQDIVEPRAQVLAKVFGAGAQHHARHALGALAFTFSLQPRRPPEQPPASLACHNFPFGGAIFAIRGRRCCLWPRAFMYAATKTRTATGGSAFTAPNTTENASSFSSRN